MAVGDPDLPLPSISDHWAYVWGDSKFTRSVPFVTLVHALVMIQRDNIGILLNHYFYPLSSNPNPLEEFDITLLSLADQLRKHCTSINTTKKLIKNSEVPDKDTITLFPLLANTINSDLGDSLFQTYPLGQPLYSAVFYKLDFSSSSNFTQVVPNSLPVSLQATLIVPTIPP